MPSATVPGPLLPHSIGPPPRSEGRPTRGRPSFVVRPAWASARRCKPPRKQAIASEANRSCARATERGEEAGSEAAGRRTGTGYEAQAGGASGQRIAKPRWPRPAGVNPAVARRRLMLVQLRRGRDEHGRIAAVPVGELATAPRAAARGNVSAITGETAADFQERRWGARAWRPDGTRPAHPPLLANVLLDEVDKELERRGHAFVRYADDCNVYVRSRRAGQRTMELLRRLFGRLRALRINKANSAVDLARNRRILGYSFWAAAGCHLRRSRQVDPSPAARSPTEAAVRTRMPGGVAGVAGVTRPPYADFRPTGWRPRPGTRTRARRGPSPAA
jgi:hypothetical protein